MAGRTVGIKLDKERHLLYDLNALAEIGDRLNITLRLDKLGEDLLGTPLPLSALRVILWAGLRHEDPALTVEDVGAMVDQNNIGSVIQRFFSLFKATLPEGVLERLGESGLDITASPTTGTSLDEQPSALSG